jgi:hypothetical protein
VFIDLTQDEPQIPLSQSHPQPSSSIDHQQEPIIQDELKAFSDSIAPESQEILPDEDFHPEAHSVDDPVNDAGDSLLHFAVQHLYLGIIFNTI